MRPVAIETLKLVPEVAETATAPASVAGAGRIVHPQVTCGVSVYAFMRILSCPAAQVNAQVQSNVRVLAG